MTITRATSAAARAAADAFQNLSIQRNRIERRLGLFRHSVPGPLRAMGFSRTPHPQGLLRPATIRRGGIGRHSAALRSYTIWAAHQLFLENTIGSIEPGKDADIAVWDRDPYTIFAAELKTMKCELTLVRGRTVFDAAGGLP